MYGHLVPCRGGKPIPLNRTHLYLGKRATGDDEPVTRNSYYCELVLEAGQWWLKDVNCPVEIRVNGHPKKEAELKSGDLIAVGHLRYRLQLAAESPAPTPPPETPPAEPAQSRTAGVLSMFGFGKRKTAEAGPPVLGVLVPCRGGKAFPLRKQRNTIGRDDTCDVVVQEKTVSGLHCGLEFVNGFWRVVDLGSTNGIMVNGVAYKKKWLLPGDTLMVAFLRFRLEYHPDGTPPEEENLPFIGKSLMATVGITGTTVDRIVAAQATADGPEPASKPPVSLTERAVHFDEAHDLTEDEDNDV